MIFLKQTALFLALVLPLSGEDFETLREKVTALSQLTTAPKVHAAEGFSTEKRARAIFYETLPYEGKETRSFAFLGVPDIPQGEKAPAIVLVHGGGGKAFPEWVEKWVARGYVAISIAVEGQMVDFPEVKNQHEWAGPLRSGIYGDSAKKLEDQWMYHAVADTILANSLLRSLPQVDPEKVGLMGISWGGVITSTVMGIDSRFAFAIPVYGCGALSTAENQYGKALGKNELYQKVWDPMVRLKNAKLPTLWLSWPKDEHFPLDCQAASYGAVSGPHMVSLIPRLRHGHSPPWTVGDSYAFADSVVKGEGPWCVQAGSQLDGKIAKVTFDSSKELDTAILVSTAGTGVTGSREWDESAATLKQSPDGKWHAEVQIPDGTTAYFINVKSGQLTASSDFQELGQK